MGAVTLEISNTRVIQQFIEKHADSERPFCDWVTKTKAAEWKNESDVSRTFNNADHLGNQKFIFYIGGNNLRLTAMVCLANGKVYLLKVMTPAEYAKEKF